MAIAKVYGIETEYGIQVVGNADGNPTTASSVLINSYVSQLAGRVGWDFEDESPGRDARGYVREGSMPPEVETHLVNTVLTNGARYYVDHAHPEYSSPECATPLELVRQDKAGELVLARSMAAARRVLPPGEEIVVYKNNSDGKGNSYGCHENYLMDRTVPFARLARQVTVHLVTRQIYTGSGKVGCEASPSPTPAFEITQRADFFEEEIGLETTLKRPIVNTRDEPHADATKYRRLHVITGDANLAEVATFLKVGVTALVLLLIEDDVLSARELVLANPVQAMRAVSHDVALTRPLELVSGESITALELQWELYDAARKYAEERGLAELGPEPAGRQLLERWEAVLSGLESDPASLRHQLDWVAKLELIDAYCARHNCGLDDHRVAALDLQYHDVRPARSLFQRLDMERLVTPAEVEAAVTSPPRDTRAYFRGECLKRFGASIVAANWDSIVFDLGDDPLRRVPMMEPLRGSAAHVDTLLDGCSSPAELLRRLGA
ncbi:MAG: proteasome accessory factor PafA2 [Acidimicrobiaceae bacterium]|nr:proteasome accessory factor PafA2 [Acidimicrobiaceae bacterium]